MGDLLKSAAVLDGIQNGLMGQALGQLPPGAQAMVGAAQQIAAALDIPMSSLSDLVKEKQKPPPPAMPGCYVDKKHIAVLMSNVTHPAPAGLAPGPGAPNVLWNGHPVWRMTADMHICPLFNGPVPHVPPTGSPVLKGSETTRAGGLFVARVTDFVLEPTGGPNPIVGGLAKGAPGDNAKQREAQQKKAEEAERAKKKAAKLRNPENKTAKQEAAKAQAGTKTNADVKKTPEAKPNDGGGKFRGHGASGSWDERSDTARAQRMAEFADNVYGDNNSPPTGSERVPGFTRRDPSSGFDAALYREKDGSLVLAFRGTEEWSDWQANFSQGPGYDTKQYEQAVALAREVKEKFPGANVQITGHSLGGGLSTVASSATGYPATTFNAANVHPNTYKDNGIYPDKIPANSTNYQVRGEPLSRLQNNAPAIGAAGGAALGSTGGLFGASLGASLGAQVGANISHSPLNQVVLEPRHSDGTPMGPIENKGGHGMKAVNEALEYKHKRQTGQISRGASGSW